MGDAALHSTMSASLRAGYRLAVDGTADSHLLELEDVTASIVPATPDRSVVNGVVYDYAETLDAALDDLAGAYEEAGVRACTVWVPEGDRPAVQVLEAAGHKLDASPRAMRAPLGQPPERRPVV